MTRTNTPPIAPTLSQEDYERVLGVLLSVPDPPVNYGLTISAVCQIAACFDWHTRWVNTCWSSGIDFDHPADLVADYPDEYLADISRYYGDDHYLPVFCVVEHAGRDDEHSVFSGSYEDCCERLDEYGDGEVDELHPDIMRVLKDGTRTTEF